MQKPAAFISPPLAFCLMLVCYCLLSIPAQAAQLIQLSDTVKEVDLGSHLDYQTFQRDPSPQEAEPSAQLLHQLSRELQPLWGNALHIPPDHNSALLRFAVNNQQDQTRVLWLSIDANKPFEAHLIQAGKEHEKDIGLALLKRYTPNNGLLQYQEIYQLQLAPRQHADYYLSFYSSANTHLDLHLENPLYSLERLSNNTLLLNSSIGALALLAIINLLIAVFVRYQWLSLHAAYLFFLSFIQIIQQGYFHSWWQAGSQTHLWLLNSGLLLANLSLSWLCCCLCFSLGAQKVWNYFTQCAVLLAAISFIAALLWPHNGIFVQNISLLFSMFLFSLLCFLIYQHDQDNNALLMCVTRFIALISLLLCWLAFKLNIASHYTFLLITLILLIENCIISLALHYRCFKRIKRHWRQRQSLLLQASQEQTQKDVLSRFSHDIRTPISGVTGMAELLNDTPLSNTQAEYVATIQSSTALILSMINNVLDSSLLDHNLNVKFAPFELHVMIDDTLRNYQSRAEHEGIELISNIDSNLPELINGDMTRIRQILSHLLSHAFSHTTKGEVLVSVKPVPQTDHEQEILFSVKDSGSGLSREQQRQLLAESAQQTGSKAVSFTLIKRLIDEMQGKLGINSAPQQGCEVWFSLPLSSYSLTDHTDTDINQVLRHKRLLIVDDNTTFTQLIRQQCQSWGVQAQEANSGSAALALLHAKENINEAFDLVIIDHQMPGMSGLQLAGKIVADPQLQTKPILLMLTGLSKAPFSDTAKTYGIRRILTKPLSGRVLKAILAEEIIYAQSLKLLDNTNTNTDDAYQAAVTLHILVAEDNTANQQIVQAMLKKLGHRVQLVNNGQEAVSLFCKQKFDLILMDYEMPVLDGLEATRAIRSWERHHKKNATPIIAMTGHIMPADITSCKEAGMNAHLAKPLTIQKLKLSIEAIHTQPASSTNTEALIDSEVKPVKNRP